MASKVPFRRKPGPLLWRHRTKREVTAIAVHVIFETKCERYRIVFWSTPLGDDNRYPDCCYAMNWVRGPYVVGWRILSKHRTGGGAQRACERHARQQLRREVASAN